MRRGGPVVLLVAVMAALATGCATPKPPPLARADYEQLGRSRVGVIVLVPEKRLEFRELLFYSTQENYYTFDGIWDPAPVFGENAVRLLHSAHNIVAVPLWTHLEPRTYGELIRRAEAAFNAARRPARADPPTGFTSFRYEALRTPPMSYLQAGPPEGLRALRDTNQIDYLCEFSIGGISVLRGGGSAVLQVVWYARLIRLTDGLVVWSSASIPLPGQRPTVYTHRIEQSRIEGLEHYSQLEANNLALLKQHYERVVRNLFDPANPNNLLRGFQPE